MTATVQDYDVAIDDVVVEPKRRFYPAWIAGIATAAVLTVGSIFIAFPSLHEDVVAGTPTANRVDVIQAAADRKIQAEADQRAADAAYLQSLDQQVKEVLQQRVDNGRYPITVIDVALIKVATNKYEGMANMQLAGYQPHQVPIHVTADDQNIMWTFDAGSLSLLFS
jgi:hypothetical protein